jgi:hypothetical protein
MLLTYFLNDFEMVPVALIITGITFVFTFHMPCISIYYYYYMSYAAISCFIVSKMADTKEKGFAFFFLL